MAFELTPDNRNQPDKVLLDDLRLAAALEGQKMSRERYMKVGRFAPATIANRFGGWEKALLLAGIKPSRRRSVSKEDCITDLKRIANELGIDTLTVPQYKKHGLYSDRAFANHFGGWVGAFRAAGLKISGQFHSRSTDEELFENLESVWQRLGRQPTVNDMAPPVSRFSADTYKRRFGGFRKALEAFVAALQGPVDTSSKDSPSVPATEEPVIKKAPRSVGWRLRYLVLNRDRFSCKACGLSPATTPGTVLQVDHIIPWSKGGRTEEANLQALCERCNIGKGAA